MSVIRFAGQTLAVMIATFAIVIGLIVLAGVLLSLFWNVLFGPHYDVDHPEYQRFSDYFSQVRTIISETRGKGALPSLDVRDVNDGDWTKMCVFGGYVDPAEKMQEFGAAVRPEDFDRWTRTGVDGYQKVPLEEGEIAIALVNRANQAQFIRFRHGIGPSGQHLERCVYQPETTLSLFD